MKEALPWTYRIVVFAAILFFNGSLCAESDFSPTVDSLQNYECPEWFRDAKFGIYCHWNAQSSVESGSNGWYARNMYVEGNGAYKHHVKTYGHPSEVGYRHIIENWKVDQFDAAEWVRLFKQAGAKYVVAMATHHDNFDLWDSKNQPRWNSTHYGPKVDVVGELRKQTLKQKLRFGVTAHMARTYSWFNTNKGADKRGPKKGIPYDGNDPAFEDLYLEKHDDTDRRHPVNPPESWREHWKARMYDLIDRYQPDHLYFDGAVPFNNDEGKAGLEVISHYYNVNRAAHNGQNEGVMCIKHHSNHGYWYDGIATLDMERKRAGGIREDSWQTDTSIGPWFHYPGARYRSMDQLIQELVDIVSKNGNVLLNIPARADGSFDPQAKRIMRSFGQWLKVNGESIYGTRPWKSFGEGELRFNVKGNILYVTTFMQHGSPIVLGSTKGWKADQVKSVNLLGGGVVPHKMTARGFRLSPPSVIPGKHAYVFKVVCSVPVADLPCRMVDQENANQANKHAETYGADGNAGDALAE